MIMFYMRRRWTIDKQSMGTKLRNHTTHEGGKQS